MNTCRMTGSTSFVRSDSPALFVGTSRQPSSTWPSLAIARSISCTHAIRDAGSFGRNTMPTPYWPIAGSVSPCAPHTRRRKRSGSWIRMPAPSPCSGSAPGGAAVREVLEDRQRLRDDRVALLPLDVRDEAQAAGVVLIRRIVKTLAYRRLVPLSRDRSFTMTSRLQRGGAVRCTNRGVRLRESGFWGESLIHIAAMLHCGKACGPGVGAVARCVQQPSAARRRPVRSKRLAPIAFLGFNLKKMG